MSLKSPPGNINKDRRIQTDNINRSHSGSRRPSLLRNPSNATSATAVAGSIKSVPTSIKKPTRPRARSINNQQLPANRYMQQEKAYLRTIRNESQDDYYTKGIEGEDELSSEEGSDEDANDNDDPEFEEKSKRELLDLEIDHAFVKQMMGGKGISADDPYVNERLVWQNMLSSVLTGDVVRSEKTKIRQQDDRFLHGTYKESLWYEIRAKLCGRTEDEQRKVVSYRRTMADKVIQEIMDFEIRYEEGKDARSQVEELLDKWDLCCSNWRTLDELRNEKLICRSEEFNQRLDALTSWYNIRNGLDLQIERIRQWIDSANDNSTPDALTAADKNSRDSDSLDAPKSAENFHKLGRFPSEPQGLHLNPTQVFDTEAQKLSKSISDITFTESENSPTFKNPSTPVNSDSPLKPKIVVPSQSEINERDLNSKSPRPSITPLDMGNQDGYFLAERLMKEKDFHKTFRKRTFAPMFPWLIKTKITYISMQEIYETLKLPDYIHDVIQLFLVPSRLIKEIIIVRLQYASKLQNPTLMMIDQMIDDFKSYITIALEVKALIMEYCRRDVDHKWLVVEFFEREQLEFDKVVLRCVRYFLILLNKKLLDGSRNSKTFRTFKEPEELEDTWRFLRCLGLYVEGGSVVVAEHVTALTSRLVHRLLAYLTDQISNPRHNSKTTPADLIRWYSTTTENYGQLRRKLARFSVEIARDFANSLVFEVSSAKVKNFLEILSHSGHFLVYTGSIESDGIYLFASRGLQGRENSIIKILQGGFIGTDGEVTSNYLKEFREKLAEYDIFEEDEPVIDEYVLALCPTKPIVWDGYMFNLPMDDVQLSDVKPGTLTLVAQHPHRLSHIKSSFLEIVEDTVRSCVSQRCSLPKVHHEVFRINKAFYRTALTVMESVEIIRSKCQELAPGGDFQELINNNFVYAKDYAKNALRHIDSKRRSTVVQRLVQLSIDWVAFICDDCTPTDRRTFRWCVLALEFAMEMTKGFNVFVLSEEQFYRLKLKVARCMSLLISHFDIMGARSSEAEKKRLMKLSAQRQNTEDDEKLIQMYHEEVAREIKALEEQRNEEVRNPIGRVIDVTDQEYQFVALLASSFSSVSIRWQKGKLIGAGSFGSVYTAVNLDTGGVMAVKEIRFTDLQSIKNIVPSIRDEMTVLEILNHPNIVQYYGVEVHRDRVYIFMEFCEGGSLSGLLNHGRIEDEMVIQVYTLQMLEGLAYLHQSGVVHRDIKPENILLDHNGIIKYVDFGAAKVIANSGRTRGPSMYSSNSQDSSPSDTLQQGQGLGAPVGSMTGTPMYMSPEVITGSASDRSGTVDIWSLGCCVLEMATGKRPWANLDNEWAIMYHIAAGHMPQLPSADQLSEQGRNFVSRCLEHDPKKRPSAAELLQDPWIEEIRKLAFDQESVATPSSEISIDTQF